NYSGGPIPKTAILEGYAADTPLPELMADTGYVHAGKSLLVNRHKNIEAALGWVDDGQEADFEGEFEAAVRQPYQYLLFASEWAPLADELGVSLGGTNRSTEDAVALIVLNHAALKNPGKRLLVGLDATSFEDDGFSRTRERAETLGAGLMIYVEGPGGPTGDEWADDEKGRIKMAAKSVGVDVTRTEREWLKVWKNGKWKDYTFKQLAKYKDQGFVAAEIDNLYQAVGESDEAVKLLQLLDEYQAGVQAGHLPRLVLKNLTGPQLRKIAGAIKSGRLSRDTFAEFHIAEKGTGTPSEQKEEAAKIAIRTIRSTNTHQYTAFGAYGLEERFDEMMGLQPA
ncbi:MAG TPA: hypothetical protein PK264_23825, partial [Hyphomicrobiaceae bacterium]|nr:hypothetical protein [Hyphomicrobiaceae bacterium]